MEKIYVTSSGYERLLRKREELTRVLRKAQTDKGQAAGGDSNAWHDNAEYDLHAQEEAQVLGELAVLSGQIESALLVDDVPTDHSALSIGHVVVLTWASGETKSYAVGGFGETDLTMEPKRLSYDAPLLAPFFGKSIGYQAIVQVRGSDEKITLRNISL